MRDRKYSSRAASMLRPQRMTPVAGWAANDSVVRSPCRTIESETTRPSVSVARWVHEPAPAGPGLVSAGGNAVRPCAVSTKSPSTESARGAPTVASRREAVSTRVAPAAATLVLTASRLEATVGAPRALSVDGLFVETAQGRTALPPALTRPGPAGAGSWTHRATLTDGRVVSLSIVRQGDRTTLSLAAQPATGVIRWGLSIDAARDEYFTGLMELVVDGPQQASCAPGITEALNLRGQKVEFLVKPTLSIYAPFYLSSRGYSVTVRSTWPGHFDFAATK